MQNFVGLSVLDGYIACGSETNEVYLSHHYNKKYQPLEYLILDSHGYMSIALSLFMKLP